MHAKLCSLKESKTGGEEEELGWNDQMKDKRNVQMRRGLPEEIMHTIELGSSKMYGKKVATEGKCR